MHLARNRWMQIFAKVVPASYFALACFAFWKSFLQTGKLTSLFWMLSEGIVVVLIVFRRPSSAVSKSPWDWFAGIAGSFLILMVRPTGHAVAPDAAGFTLQLLGTGFQIYGKTALGRSFGIVAANRGVVVDGPYRWVRHPIYLGYLVTHAGFLLSNWSPRNLAVYAAAYFFQAARIFAEERVLLGDGKYREYAASVRYRLLPGIF
ncbi:MAG: isoprenylcysteine carboxyl methyltransferase [Deltaproteobacteria bacterium]|nr:isoprenylcysteine carboxyl methyltransferase [Deltaproteobacteria bacterium]